MRARIAVAGAIVAVAAGGSAAAAPFLTPGLYRVEVRIALPHVQDPAPPQVMSLCIRAEHVESGQAFFILSDNPLRHCNLVDYELKADTATYRVECPGPNRGNAVAVFRSTGAGYRGSISMNMGGKNMTMSELQTGTRIGDCQ